MSASAFRPTGPAVSMTWYAFQIWNRVNFGVGPTEKYELNDSGIKGWI
jgi:hypothetical protein